MSRRTLVLDEKRWLLNETLFVGMTNQADSNTVQVHLWKLFLKLCYRMENKESNHVSEF